MDHGWLEMAGDGPLLPGRAPLWDTNGLKGTQNCWKTTEFMDVHGKIDGFLGIFCLTQSIVPCKSYFSKVNQAMQIAFPPALGENQPGKPGGTLQDIAPGVWTATFIVTTLPTAMASRCLGQWCGAVMREACGNWKSQLAETLCSYGNIWRYNLLGSLIDVLSRFSHIHVGLWWRALFDRNL